MTDVVIRGEGGAMAPLSEPVQMTFVVREVSAFRRARAAPCDV
jgi:hypothetical protein